MSYHPDESQNDIISTLKEVEFQLYNDLDPEEESTSDLEIITHLEPNLLEEEDLSQVAINPIKLSLNTSAEDVYPSPDSLDYQITEENSPTHEPSSDESFLEDESDEEDEEMIGEYPEAQESERTMLDIAQSTAPRENEISADTDEANIIPDGVRRVSRPSRRMAYSLTKKELEEGIGYKQSLAALVHQPQLFQHPNLKSENNERENPNQIPVSHLPPPPKSYWQLQKHSEKDGFLKAMKDEWLNLIEKDTFEEITDKVALELCKTNSCRPLPLKWVYTYKQDQNGQLLKYKARVCVRGDLHRSDRDTYAATLSVSTFRALMALVAAFDMEIVSLDAVNAFLNSDLDETVVCNLAPGFEKDGIKIRLKKALYGLPCSPLLWSKTVVSSLNKLGFEEVPGVDCLMTNGKIITFFFVDDFIAIALPRFKKELLEFKEDLQKTFKMRECNPDKFLGIRIIRNRIERKLWILQDVYIENMATKYHLNDISTTIKTPLHSSYPLARDPKYGAAETWIKQFQQKVGSIGHAAVFTRPDIAKAHSLLSERLTNPTEDDIESSNRCIRYLYNTRYLAIMYDGKGAASVFEAASDAAFADDMYSRKSSEAFLFKLFGGPIAWASKKQSNVTRSTTEAELASLSRAATHFKWWTNFFHHIGFDPEQDSKIMCDNQAAISIATGKCKQSSKHRTDDIHRKWLQQETARNWIRVEYIPTSRMPADG